MSQLSVTFSVKWAVSQVLEPTIHILVRFPCKPWCSWYVCILSKNICAFLEHSAPYILYHLCVGGQSAETGRQTANSAVSCQRSVRLTLRCLPRRCVRLEPISRCLLDAKNIWLFAMDGCFWIGRFCFAFYYVYATEKFLGCRLEIFPR